MKQKITGIEAINAMLEGKALIYKKSLPKYTDDLKPYTKEIEIHFYFDKKRKKFMYDQPEGFEYSINNPDPNDAFCNEAYHSLNFFLSEQFEIMN